MSDAITEINELLSLDLVITIKKDFSKGRKPDPDEGGTCKLYLDKKDCLALSEAFAKLAEEITNET